MQRMDLVVQTREAGQKDGKKNVRQLRREGWVPAVVYGHGEPTPVLVNDKELSKAIHTEAGSNAIFNVKLGSKSELSVIKEIQRDIFTRRPIHVDFQRIDAKEKIELTIPIHITGESNGVKNQGGILEFIQRDLRIKCLPDDLVSNITVDVTTLDLHHSIRVSDVPAPKGVEFMTPGDHIIVNIVSQKVEEVVAAPGTEGAAAQPEVITKGKKDEEGAAAGTAAPAAAGAKAADKGAKVEKKK